MFTFFTIALQSIWNHKVRSLLTVLGVVIGVSSVTILISLGQGLKNDVSGLIQGFGTNVIVVLSGNVEASNGQVNPSSFVSNEILTLEDVEAIQQHEEIMSATPIGLVNGTMRYQDKTAAAPIFGAFPSILDAFEVLELETGHLFDSRSAGNVVVIGPTTKETLFGEEDPVGKMILLGEREMEVIGAFGASKSTSIFGSEFDNVAVIPFDTATDINERVSISRIVAKAADDADVAVVKEVLFQRILELHGGEEDFSVLTQDDLLDLFNQFLDLSTALVSAIAAISLVVGGIGIMNIMLVTVTERTKEIGLRKAVGATKWAILIQFLIEAIVITSVGGAIGLGVAILAGVIVRTQTPLVPDITLDIVAVALGISTVIGIVFGLWPAIRAANKDPIEALRSE